MGVTYKFSGATSKKPEDIIAEVKATLTEAPKEPKDPKETIEDKPEEPTTITISNYTAFVTEVMQKVVKAKRHGGLLIEFVSNGTKDHPGPIFSHTVCNVSTLAKEFDVDKSEIQKIWDMV